GGLPFVSLTGTAGAIACTGSGFCGGLASVGGGGSVFFRAIALSLRLRIPGALRAEVAPDPAVEPRGQVPVPVALRLGRAVALLAVLAGELVPLPLPAPLPV